MSDETSSRPGSGVDLSRRMDRIEAKYDDLASEVGSIKATIGRVEANQTHADEVNKLRFAALDAAVGSVGAKLDAFITRVDGIITGEVQTAQTRQGQEMVADYMRWRKEVDEDRERLSVLTGRLDLLGRMAVLLVTSNMLALAAALYALVNG